MQKLPIIREKFPIAPFPSQFESNEISSSFKILFFRESFFVCLARSALYSVSFQEGQIFLLSPRTFPPLIECHVLFFPPMALFLLGTDSSDGEHVFVL